MKRLQQMTERVFWMKLNMFCKILSGMAAILHSVVFFLSTLLFLDWQITKSKPFIYPRWSVISKEKLITHVVGPDCLCPHTDRQAVFHQGQGGWRAAVRRNQIAVRPASVTERPHERSWQCSFRPGLGQQENVYVCVHLVSAYFMVVCENRKLWLAFTWFTWGMAGGPIQNLTVDINYLNFFFFQLLTCEKTLSFFQLLKRSNLLHTTL